MSRPVPYNVPSGSVFPSSPAIPAKRFNTQRFNQVVRLAVQLAGTPFVSASDIKLKASWDTLIAATDATKIILSPPFSGSKITPSKALETGADTNATYEGLPIYFGEGTAMFSAEFNDVDAAVIDAFFAVVSSFSMGNGIGSNSLTAYWINNDGHIFSTPLFAGLPCINLAPRTRGTDGLNSSDKIPFSFYLPPNWDGNTTLPTPNVPAIGTAGQVDVRAYAW